MNADELRTKAETYLRANGPTEARTLARDLGLPNARGLSMALQWSRGRFENRHHKWHLAGLHDGAAAAEIEE